MKESLSTEKLDSLTTVCVANFLPSYQPFPAMGSDPIERPSSEHKPFDITSAAIDYVTAVSNNMRQ